MKHVRYCLLLLLIILIQPVFAQNKKYDKSLAKIDASFNAGKFSKASSALAKLKKSITSKMGAENPYMPQLYIREARITMALGVFTTFDNTLNNALTSSLAVYGENSTSYASTLIDVAEIYNSYGNHRISREYVGKARDLLKRTDQLTDPLKGRLALVEAEAMIGQGYWDDALELLASVEDYFVKRAVEKQTTVEEGKIKTQRVPEEELPTRFGDYVKLITLRGNAYGAKGVVSPIGGDESADLVFKNLDQWIKDKRKYFGETSLATVQYRYDWAHILIENGNEEGFDQKNIELDRILSDLKSKTSPTNTLAHNLYLLYLRDLLKNDNRARYINTKLEYQKIIDKSYPKISMHNINLRAVEFDSKIDRDKTKNLEAEALSVLGSKSLPKNHKTNLLILQFLYDVALIEKRYTNAESYLVQMGDVKKEIYGDNTPEYHLHKLKLANFYLDYTNKIEEAGNIFEESYVQKLSSTIGIQHKDLLEILNHLANYYELVDQYKKASQTLISAGKAVREKYDNTHILYAREMIKIADLKLKLGEYEAAGEDLNVALKIIDDRGSRSPHYYPAYIDALETQAKLYGIKGMFDEAVDNLEKSKKLFGKADVLVSNELSSAEELTSLFIQLGRYSDATKLLAAQIPEYEKLYGRNSMHLIEPLVNEGRIQLANAEYSEAEKTAIRANQIAVKAYGDTSTKTAPTQRLLSDIAYTLGDYDRAQDNLIKAIASQEKQFGRNHIEVAKSISQLALTKFHKGDNKKEVERLMTEAQKIMVDKLGNTNPQYAEILKNVAVLYISEKRFDVAFNALTVAEGIWRAKTGSKNNINLASIYILTGDVYYQLKTYNKAEEFYDRGKEIYERFFNNKHPEYVKILAKLGKVYYMKADYKRSKKFIEEALDNYENYIKQYFPAQTEAQKAKYWNTIRGDFEFYNTLAFSNLEDFRDLSGKVYNYQLLTKALLLSSTLKMRERIVNSTDEELKNQYNTWTEKKELMTLALSMSPSQLAERSIDPASLQQEVDRLEKELSEKSELFGQSFDNKRVTFEDVRKSLKPNEVVVEMIRYRHFNHSLTDSVIYAALYLKSDFSKPKVIILNDGKKLETRFFKYYRYAITGMIPDQYSYNAFWKQIADEIGQASTIYLSADGVYNQINLESLPTPDGRYVIDNANIVLISNSKDLYWRKVKTRPKSTDNRAYLIGNPSFYESASTDNAIAQLPGTEKEINQLDFMLKQKAWLTTVFVEKGASEEKIKEINNARVVHLATHGFYKPSVPVTLAEEIQGNEAILTQNPFMRNGLLLKGAGDLMDKTDFNYNMESGILTAQEAMSLNLDKTDMVVLSACETGLGDLEAGEGVMGLQRAFLVAGAKFLVMSMFKVDDDATQKLMLKFYQKWLNSGNFRQSFTEAKIELRAERPEPLYWGAFMIIGLE